MLMLSHAGHFRAAGVAPEASSVTPNVFPGREVKAPAAVMPKLLAVPVTMKLPATTLASSEST